MGVYKFSQMSTVLHDRTRAVNTMGQIIVRIVASRGLERIVAHTPVDTSRLVSNWQVSTGNPKSGEVPPKSIRGAGKTNARALTLSAGIPTIMGYRGGGLFIANNAPYVGVIEYGDSKHKPSGMAAKGLQAMRVRAKGISITSVMSGKDPT